MVQLFCINLLVFVDRDERAELVVVDVVSARAAATCSALLPQTDVVGEVYQDDFVCDYGVLEYDAFFTLVAERVK